MLLTGVNSPDNIKRGRAIMKQTSSACCIVSMTDESNSPVPTTAIKKNTIPT